MRIILPVLICLYIWSIPAWGHTPMTSPAEAERLRVYLMTIGPGEAVYERFGHNQIWIHDPVAGTDIAYNYGVFDFNQENFIWRFIQGRMLYRCEAIDADIIAAWYRHHHPDRRLNLGPEQWLAMDYIAAERSVWVQELNLTARQKYELQQFLEWNVTPPNHEYRYDYYTDNCSTRVRDALDRVLGGQIAEQTRNLPTHATFRWHTRRLTRPDWPLYTALYAVLGQPVDRPITRWEEMFLPVKLMEHLRQIKVVDENGEAIDLVRREWQLFASQAFAVPDAPPQYWWIGYGLTGIVLGTLLAAMGRMARSGHRIAQRVMGLGIALWGLIAGVAGAIGTWAWFTDHASAWWNENWLQLNPVSLVLVVTGFMMALHTRQQSNNNPARGTYVAWWAAGIVLGLSVLGAIGQLLPQLDQVNGETIWLALPLHAGTWLAIHTRLGGREPVPPKDLPGQKLA